MRLEHVREFMIARKRANFMLNKAVFTGIAGSYDEENQRSAAGNLPLAAD
jgi:hypothetical protein